MVAEEHNTQKLATLRDGRIRRTTEEIAVAMTGDYRDEHLFVRQQELQRYEFYPQQISQFDQQLARSIGSEADPGGKGLLLIN